MAEYRTAAPMLINTGIKDDSYVIPPIEPTPIPQHMPKLYIRAAKGPAGSSIFNAATEVLTTKYGSETFREGSKFYNHQTAFLKHIVGKGNNCVVHNIVAPNAKDVANIVFYLDVLEAEVPVYERNVDGSYVYDDNGDPKIKKNDLGEDEMILGFKVAWVTDYTEAPLGDYEMGMHTVREGLQSENGEQSKQYPMFEFAIADIGAEGNQYAVQLSAFHTRNPDFPSALLTDAKAYPYRFSLHKLSDPMLGTVDLVRNALGGGEITFVLDPEVIDPSSGQPISLETGIDNFYIDYTGNGNMPLGGVYTYTDNYYLWAKSFAMIEHQHQDGFTDPELADNKDAFNAFNIFSFNNSTGIPYNTAQLVDIEGSTRLANNANQFFKGGDEGTMTTEEYEAVVRADLRRYADPLDPYLNQVKAVETYIHDSGFSLETKLEMGNFIALRKDTIITLATFIDGQVLNNQQQFSMSLTLDAMLKLYPESTEWATGVCRAVIIGFAGYPINSMVKKRVTANYSIVGKIAAMMGAASGEWDMRNKFDHAPGSVVTDMIGFDYEWVPASTRHKYWAANLNFPLSYSTDYVWFPAMKTVCSQEGSTLNSFFTVAAAAHLDRIGHAAWREYSGASLELTDGQLVIAVADFIKREAKDKFAGTFQVIPHVTITEKDAIRGYSWTAVIELRTPTMKTVMRLTINTKRYEEFAN